MAKVGAQRAADLTGRSKSTIQRAMNTGKLSFEVDANNRRLVDVSELDRAFGLMPQGAERADSDMQSELEKATQALETERMKMRIRMLEDQLDTARDQIGDLKAQRDQWQKQAQQVLLTSQYSQKQAEEYKEKLDQQQRAVQARRQQMQDQQRRQARPAQPAPAGATAPAKAAGSSNENRKADVQPAATAEQMRGARAFDLQGLWTKLRRNPAMPGADKAEVVESDRAA